MEMANEAARRYNSIKHWEPADRPREKFLQLGRQQLSDAELIALLLGTGYGNQNAIDLARQLLARFQGNLDQLGKASVAELSQLKGIGQAKALSLAAALELGRRRKAHPSQQNLLIKRSYDIYQGFRQLFDDLQHEEFRVLLLNRANRVLAQILIGVGGVSATVADPKKIMRAIIEQQASAVILMHNHPSGVKKASQADIKLTEKVKQLCLLLDVDLIDHIIFLHNDYLSLRDDGLL